MILQTIVKDKFEAMQSWLAEQMKRYPPPLYSSVDIRYNKHKISPVDTNLFPSGFNNLSQSSLHRASQLIPFTGKKVLLITENFQRNKHYYHNILCLSQIIESKQNIVELGNYEITDILSITVNDKEISILPVIKEGIILKTTNGFIPELIILNNDLMNGVPAVLEDVSQKILPPLHCGWHVRSKHKHHLAYQEVISQFCNQFDIDPWLISTECDLCCEVKFKNHKNLDRLARSIDTLIEKIRLKYQEYRLKDLHPHVFIKSDHGTYGMGIMIADSGSNVLTANKRTRQKMYTTKGNRDVSDLYLQEGVSTEISYKECSAEPILYNIMDKNAAVILRYHPEKDNHSNLNAPGAQFADISEKTLDLDKNLLEVIGKLCIISASIEMNG